MHFPSLEMHKRQATSGKRASREDNMTLKEYRKKLLELELKPITNSEDLKKFNNDRDRLLCEFKGWKNQQARNNDTTR